MPIEVGLVELWVNQIICFALGFVFACMYKNKQFAPYIEDKDANCTTGEGGKE